jgi:hypothetical protein
VDIEAPRVTTMLAGFRHRRQRVPVARRQSRGLRWQGAELPQAERALETRIQRGAAPSVVAGVAVVVGEQPSSAKPRRDPHLHVERQRVELGPARLRDRVKVGAFGAFPEREDSVRDGHVEMNIQVQASAEALREREGPAAYVAEGMKLRALALPAEDLLDEDATGRGERAWVPGEQEPELVGHAEHPLAQGNVRENMIHEVRCGAAHPPRAVAHPLPKPCPTPVVSRGLPGTSGEGGFARFVSYSASLARKVAYRLKVSPTPLGRFESLPLR